MANEIVALAPWTELDAINEMLSAVGVAPVVDLATTTSRDANLAKAVLKTVAREVLLEKWRFNCEFGVQVLPSQQVTWVNDEDGTSTLLNVFEPPLRGQATASKRRQLLRWALTKWNNFPGSGFGSGNGHIAVSLSPPTCTDLVDGKARTITAISIASSAVVTSVDHGFIAGQSVVIAGTDSTPAIDGLHVVNVIDDDSFSVPVTTTGTGSAGTATNETPQLIFYDSRLGRDGFNTNERSDLFIDAVWSVDFVDMPPSAQDYIVKRASRRFAQSLVGSQETVSYTERDEAIARRVLKREQGLEKRFNFLNNPNARVVHGRNNYVQHSQLDSAGPRGGTV
jgi:hypothetical protein